MSLRPPARARVAAAVAGLLLHTVTALWVWRSWGEFGRSNVIAWIDFPVSLAYLHLDGPPLLSWSLALGGLQWAGIAAFLAFLLGQSTHWRT
jgi:hypothetical protein